MHAVRLTRSTGSWARWSFLGAIAGLWACSDETTELRGPGIEVMSEDADIALFDFMQDAFSEDDFVMVRMSGRESDIGGPPGQFSIFGIELELRRDRWNAAASGEDLSLEGRTSFTNADIYSFASENNSSPVVERVLFSKLDAGRSETPPTGEQRISGRLRLEALGSNRVAGEIDVLVSGVLQGQSASGGPIRYVAVFNTSIAPRAE